LAIARSLWMPQSIGSRLAVGPLLGRPHKADKLLIEPAAGARPAPPCHLDGSFARHAKRPVTRRVTSSTETPGWQPPQTDRPTRRLLQSPEAAQCERTIGGDGRAGGCRPCRRGRASLEYARHGPFRGLLCRGRGFRQCPRLVVGRGVKRSSAVGHTALYAQAGFGHVRDANKRAVVRCRRSRS